MSLDVYLTLKGAQLPKDKQIFIREDGMTKAISHNEWYARFPDREPVTLEPDDESDEVYSANITHNLNKMAREAGIYEHLWRPEEIGITKANQLIVPLSAGLIILRSDPERFQKLNPENGWGNYVGLVKFVENYLDACKKYPDAEVYASR